MRMHWGGDDGHGVDDVLLEFGKGRGEREMVGRWRLRSIGCGRELRALGEAAYAISEPGSSRIM